MSLVVAHRQFEVTNLEQLDRFRGCLLTLNRPGSGLPEFVEISERGVEEQPSPRGGTIRKVDIVRLDTFGKRNPTLLVQQDFDNGYRMHVPTVAEADQFLRLYEFARDGKR